MPTIKVRVRGKIAENLTPEVKIVCRNSDYKVEFEFDEPWQAHELKTALFVYNGASVPVPFSGNVCEMPELYNTTLCAIGVFAGDLITTTPAYADCLKAISDLGGETPPPTEDVYNKLVQMIESGMLKGEQGEKGDKGEKGDAGAIKFITVVALPTENIDESAIYLVPIENADGENRFTEYAYIDGKWETLGAISIQVDHSEYVKFTDYATASKAGIVKSSKAQGITISSGGLMIIEPRSNSDIDNRVLYGAITPKNIDYAVKVGITTNTETLTDEEKTSACEWLGALKQDTSTNNYLRLYAINPDGSQTVVAASNVREGNAIVRYSSDGRIDVGSPNRDYQAANKKFVEDGFVAKTTTGGNRVYVSQSTADGELVNSTVTYVEGPYAYTIALRGPNGRLSVGEPIANDNATTKAYVDGLIAELVARIEALENK